ncbi:MAG: sulfurtransferase [Gammaproteobacteria bacterium]|nr:sulfurtransferase [Gammaproteobacteria bacterium]
MNRISAKALKARLDEPAELAFIDVREPGQYGDGHPFFAINIPYSRLELDVARLIPHPHTEVVLIDQGDGVAERACERLQALGFTRLGVVEGGCPAWAKAGYTLFDGLNLPSKTFGEVVEETFHTPHIDANTLQRMRDSGEDFLLLDGRTAEEFARMNIPGGRICPNAELGHRLPVLDPEHDRTVVVNCAGRTRSIIGAQSLLNLGFSQRIVALENGTQGWTLAGFELERGSSPKPLPSLSADALQASRARARRTIERFALPTVDEAQLAQWQQEPRNLFLLDVRTEEEYEQGHLPGALHAPGGQLTQATDAWVGVRNATIVLCDDTGLRAANTAIWLRGMRHHAYVLDCDVSGHPARTTERPVEPMPQPLAEITAAELDGYLSKGAPLFDLRASQRYRDAHLEAARWATRARLPSLLGSQTPATVVLVADDPRLAALAAIDLRASGIASVLLPGTSVDAWRKAGLSVVSTPDAPSDAERIDFIFHTHDRHQGNLEASRAYLAWETGLIARLDDQERASLQPLRPTD